MALLFSAETAAIFSGEFVGHFDTFTQYQTPIVVNKEPIKTIVTNNQAYAGYGNDDSAQDFTLTPVSATFPALILYEYSTQNPDLENPNIKVRLAGNQVTIKVKEDAKNYIKNGKTENIIVDGNIYNVVTLDKVQHYLGLQYYYFDLEATY